MCKPIAKFLNINNYPFSHINFYGKGAFILKIFSFKLKSILLVAFIILTVCGCVLFAASKITDTVSAQTRLLPVYRVDTQDNRVAVTFNCADGGDDIDKILSILEAYNIKSTFFILGTWADKNEEYVLKISEAGHELGNHSYSHKDMPSLSSEQIILDIQKCNETVKRITGKTPSLFRAPSGSYDNKTISAAQELNMFSIQWDTDSLDWKNISAEEIYKRVTSKIQKGSVIQFHTGTAHTAEALPAVLDFLKENGLVSVPVGELIFSENYIIDSNGVQKQEFSTD